MTRLAALFSFALMALAAPSGQANVLVTDLSKDQISIRGGFTGETLLLFGAIDPTPHGPVDGVVVVLRGPGESVTLRKKQKASAYGSISKPIAWAPCRAFWPLSVPLPYPIWHRLKSGGN